jgi:hypothetical protein
MVAETRLIAAPSVVTSSVGDELVLLDLDRGIYYGLNPTGARVWELLIEGSSTTEVIAKLAADHEVACAVVEKEVVRIVEELREKKLLSAIP